MGKYLRRTGSTTAAGSSSFGDCVDGLDSENTEQPPSNTQARGMVKPVLWLYWE
jgi:hypothetical protein